MIRPVVSVFSVGDDKRLGSVVMPKTFGSPLRLDLVRYIYTCMSKNKRQPYAISNLSGYQTSAVSWGTGRAVSRVPRVHGGGTHRAGQAANANFCREGGMYAPTKTWRRWYRKINLKEKRLAVAASVASTAIVPLVMARGHRIEQALELPLVLDDALEQLEKTKDAKKALEMVGLGPELERVAKAATKTKAGRGKTRGRRKRNPIGPLIILSNKHCPARKAFRNLPGVEVASVDRLNLLKLAPGGTFGRLCVWSKSAFNQLDSSLKMIVSNKIGDNCAAILKNVDVESIVNSTPVQSVLLPPRKGTPKTTIKRPTSTKVIKFVRSKLARINAKRAPIVLSKAQIKERKIRSRKYIDNIYDALECKRKELDEIALKEKQEQLEILQKQQEITE